MAATGHKPSALKSNSTHHFKVCTVCYTEIAGSKAAHSGGTATCITKAKCKDCGVSYGELADPSLAADVWGFIDASGHAHLCLAQDCYHRGEVVPHRSSGAATENSDEVCLDCGYVITLAANHTHTALEIYQYDAQSHWKACGCGEIMDKKDHINSNEDNKCDICGYLLSGDAPGSTEDPGSTDNPGDNTEDVTTPADTDSGSKNKNAYVIWIVLAVSLALGAAAGVVFVILNKKKK